MMSVDMKKAHQWAVEYDKTLRATDPRFNCAVKAIHEEGTTFFYHHAFVLRHCTEDGYWYYCIFPEHHEVKILSEDEVVGVWQFERIPVEKSPDSPEERFCEWCGKRMALDDHNRNCPDCAQFCHRCGAEVDADYFKPNCPTCIAEIMRKHGTDLA